VLDDLLDLGIVMLERTRPGSGKIGDYRIRANSLGISFLEGVDGIKHGPLAGLARCPEADRLREYALTHPPLALVRPFLDRVGATVADVVRRHPRCAVVTGLEVDEIRYRPEGGLAISATGPPGAPGAPGLTVNAERALIAMGGVADDDLTCFDPELGAILRSVRGKTTHSDSFVDGTRTPSGRLLRSIKETGRVVIVGSSHSAWSTAILLRQGGIDGLPVTPLDVCILARSKIRLFYTAAADAVADAYPFEESDICRLSGRINRYGGLRGEARELARAALGITGEPPGVRILPLAPTDEVRAELDQCGAVVLATGHRARLPRLRRADGEAIVPAHADGGTVVNDLAHLVGVDGGVHPALIAYGLGAGLRPTPEIGGEPSFHRRATGVWLYQNHLGAMVVRDVLSTANRVGELL
jgi:hypothetical protein